MRLTQPTRWDVAGVDALTYAGWYLVNCNHQSWVDIFVLQHLLNRRIPLLKFFLKQQLIYVPVIGLAWWALDFPFMKRHSKAALRKHPELRLQDREATRRACAKFRAIPVAIMNFVEGTRFTPAKHDAQKAPYQHLLKPKSGGVAFVLDAMGDGLHSIIDVTIAYPGGRPSLIDLLADRVPEVRVLVRQRAIPEAMVRGDYQNDRGFRVQFQQWMNGLWQDKDVEIARMLAQVESGSSGRD